MDNKDKNSFTEDVINKIERIPNWVTLLAISLIGYFANNAYETLISRVDTLTQTVEEMKIDRATRSAMEFDLNDHMQYQQEQRAIDEDQNEVLRGISEEVRNNRREMNNLRNEIQSIKDILKE